MQVQADTASDFFAINNALSNTSDLNGIDDWTNISEEPISLQAVNSAANGLLNFSTANRFGGGGCSVSTVANQIIVSAEEGAVVNIESSQTSRSSEIISECNTVETLIK